MGNLLFVHTLNHQNSDVYNCFTDGEHSDKAELKVSNFKIISLTSEIVLFFKVILKPLSRERTCLE